MRLTLLTHIDDSLLGVEGGGQALLNLNDALHSSRREMIVEYCRVLRGRFPRLDYLFCGFGGASYFPNCVHLAGKDDAAVARARERWFLQNFGLIAQLLQPRLAFPFAAHFVLPDERNWWISKTRLQLEAPSTTLRALSPDTSVRFEDLNPGDWVEDSVVHASPRQTPEPDAVRMAVLGHYPPPALRPPLDQAGFDELVAEVRARVESRAVPASFDAVIVLTDFSQTQTQTQTQVAIRLSASATGTRVETIDRSAVASAGASVDSLDPTPSSRLEPEVVMETRSDLLRSTLRSPFGKDLISIGYGAQFRVRSTRDLDAAPHDRLLQLLAPAQPRWREHLRERPWRTARYIVGDPSMRYAAAARLLRRRQPQTSEPAPYELRDWVTAPEA